MMDETETRLECLKLATTLISPSVGDRISAVTDAGERLYKFVICDNVPIQGTDTPKRGRPPKPRPEVI